MEDELQELDAAPPASSDISEFEQPPAEVETGEDAEAPELICHPKTIWAYNYSCVGGVATFTTAYCVDVNYPAYTARAGFYHNDARVALTAPYVRNASAYPGSAIAGNLLARGAGSANRMVVYWWKGSIYDPGDPLVNPPVSKWFSLPACR